MMIAGLLKLQHYNMKEKLRKSKITSNNNLFYWTNPQVMLPIFIYHDNLFFDIYFWISNNIFIVCINYTYNSVDSMYTDYHTFENKI